MKEEILKFMNRLTTPGTAISYREIEVAKDMMIRVFNEIPDHDRSYWKKKTERLEINYKKRKEEIVKLSFKKAKGEELIRSLKNQRALLVDKNESLQNRNKFMEIELEKTLKRFNDIYDHARSLEEENKKAHEKIERLINAKAIDAKTIDKHIETIDKLMRQDFRCVDYDVLNKQNQTRKKDIEVLEKEVKRLESIIHSNRSEISYTAKKKIEKLEKIIGIEAMKRSEVEALYLAAKEIIYKVGDDCNDCDGDDCMDCIDDRCRERVRIKKEKAERPINKVWNSRFFKDITKKPFFSAMPFGNIQVVPKEQFAKDRKVIMGADIANMIIKKDKTLQKMMNDYPDAMTYALDNLPNIKITPETFIYSLDDLMDHVQHFKNKFRDHKNAIGYVSLVVFEGLKKELESWLCRTCSFSCDKDGINTIIYNGLTIKPSSYGMPNNKLRINFDTKYGWVHSQGVMVYTMGEKLDD